MGKNGPCCHCGVTSTPLWRNGPPEKPVLCNACGSRWRTKGSLTNYTPLHAREAGNSSEEKVTKVKCVPSKPKDQKLLKKKQNNVILENGREMQFCDQNFQKIVEGDTSNRSSSGSAISYSESCAHFGTTDASDLAGSAQSNDRDSQPRSRKKTYINCRKPSSVERLMKDLHSIMHEQQSSYLSECSEGDLLYQRETPMGSFEIGYGSVLIRHPNLKLMEEESEASSFTVDNRLYTTDEAYSGSASFPINCETKGTNFSNVAAQEQKSTAQADQDNVKRDKLHQKLLVLQEADSPLISIDLKDIVNFENFMKYLTYEEQQQLLKHLPAMDSMKPPASLRSMFSSSQFMETLHYFQKLLGEGIFSLSSPGTNIEERRNLKRLVLHSSTKSKWVECYKQLKEKRSKQIKGQEVVSGPHFPVNSNVSHLKRPCNGQNHKYKELKGTMRSPKRICKYGSTNLPPRSYSQLNSSIAAHEFIDDPRSFLEFPPDRRFSLALLEQIDDSSDHDLLLDIPCNSSFPEAELLYHPLRQKSATNSSQAESGVADADAEGSLYSYQSSNFS